MFKRKRNVATSLQESFGKVKDDSFSFEWIEKYFRGKDNSDAFQVLSDKTCNDLDFDELFMFLDRTSSKVGQQYLYQKLRVIPKSTNTLDENRIELFLNNSDLRNTVQMQLVELKSYEAYFISSLFQEEYIKAPKWFFLLKILSLASFLAVLLIPVYSQILLVILGIFILNIAIHLWNKRNLFQYLDSIPQLLKMIKIAERLFGIKELKPVNSDLSKSLLTTTKIKRRMSVFRLEAKIENDLTALVWGFVELFKILFLIEPLFLFGVLKQLDSKRKEIEDIFQFIGEIDCALSVASLRAGLPEYCKPTILENGKTLQAEEIYHPLIINCVDNDIEVKNNSILLTGSNMSGKTSFIRTIGVNVIVGLTLNTCFAGSFLMPRMNVYSAIRISDDLLNDKSYYFEEVLTIKEMIDKNSDEEPNLFLLDEIFKGTNTVERISAGKAVLSSLNSGNNIVFVSTHDIELADLLRDEYDLYHFSEIVDNNNVDFDYKLKAGKLENRNAIKILKLNNYPPGVIDEAICVAQELDKLKV